MNPKKRKSYIVKYGGGFLVLLLIILLILDLPSFIIEQKALANGIETLGMVTEIIQEPRGRSRCRINIKYLANETLVSQEFIALYHHCRIGKIAHIVYVKDYPNQAALYYPNHLRQWLYLIFTKYEGILFILFTPIIIVFGWYKDKLLIVFGRYKDKLLKKR
jgi:hypothetical protein